MKTEIIKLDINNMDMDKLKFAAEVLKRGGLVAFPTETVYGLGADALNEQAVKSIFYAKGRPSDNPLIVHIADMLPLKDIVREIPAAASKVMETFWPGPITLVMKKSGIIPDVITAGLDTVAVRMPSHPVALALIKLSGIPIAAPSANTSGRPSPTCAKHVIEDLFGKVDVIIDAGSTEVGLESTVLDVTADPPMILRPGGVTKEQLQKLFGTVSADPASVEKGIKSDVTPRSPGMKYKHYSPKADVMVFEGELGKVVGKINEVAADFIKQGETVGVLATDQTKTQYHTQNVISMGDRQNPETIASSLFYALREFDEAGVDIILAEAVERKGIGLAVMNRMNKAAGFNIIKVT